MIIEFIIRATRVAYVKNIIMITDHQIAENVILAVDLALEQPKMTVDPVLFQVIELIIPITIVVSVIQDSLNQE